MIFNIKKELIIFNYLIYLNFKFFLFFSKLNYNYYNNFFIYFIKNIIINSNVYLYASLYYFFLFPIYI